MHAVRGQRVADVLVVILFGFTCGCSGASDQNEDEAERFLRLGWDTQAQEIRTYPPNPQIDLLILEQQRSKPSNSALREAVASTGAPLIPYVRQTFEGQPTNLQKRELLCVLLYVETLNYSDVANDRLTMQLAEAQAKTLVGEEGREASVILELMHTHAKSEHSGAVPGQVWQGLVGPKHGC